MHVITFETKRAHLSGVAYGRRKLAGIESDKLAVFDRAGRPLQLITPARFDLLYAIYTAERRGSSAWFRTASQALVREKLGLHLSTVSKMISRLIAIGILEERPPAPDRRHRIVSFTESGAELFQRALRLVFKTRALASVLEEHILRSTKTKAPRSRRRWKLHAAMFRLYSPIRQLALRLGDWSTGLYFFRRNGIKDRQSAEAAALRQRCKEIDRFIDDRNRRRGTGHARPPEPEPFDASQAAAWIWEPSSESNLPN
jgi:DNA-binding MarR family transcriptional regulator